MNYHSLKSRILCFQKSIVYEMNGIKRRMFNWRLFSRRSHSFGPRDNDRITNDKKKALENQVSPARGSKSAQVDPIETYRILCCAICATHDCPFHGLSKNQAILLTIDLDRIEGLPTIVDDSKPYEETEPCSDDCGYFVFTIFDQLLSEIGKNKRRGLDY
jgi:hypothetical protein